LVIVGAVLEIGIEPNAVTPPISDYSRWWSPTPAARWPEAAERSIASLDYSLLSYCATATAPRPRSSTPSEPDDPDHSIRLPACGFQKSCTER
jgi:hypothetical protein